MRSRKRKPQRAGKLSVALKVCKSASKSFSNISVKIMVGASDSHLKERIKPIIVTLWSYKSTCIFREPKTCKMFLTFHQKIGVMTLS